MKLLKRAGADSGSRRARKAYRSDACTFYVSAFGFFGDKLIEYVQEDEVVGVLRPSFDQDGDAGVEFVWAGRTTHTSCR